MPALRRFSRVGFMNVKKVGLAAALWSVLAVSASAYTTYMKPAAFHYPDGERVVVETAFATSFFTPVIGLNSPAFAVVGPDGRALPFAGMEVAGTMTRLEALIPDNGTYRVTTGERLGDITTLVGENGTWAPLAQGATPPEGAQTTTIQTVTVADAYVTKGAPTRGAIDAPMGRLAIRPITHPNQVLAAQGLQVSVVFDGQPFANIPVVLYASGDPETKQDRFFVTDAQGHATITVDRPGAYLIAVRHRAPAPADAGVATRSYTTSLTFEALAALPQMVNPPEQRFRMPRDPRTRQIPRN